VDAAWVGVIGTAVGGGVAALAAAVTSMFAMRQTRLQLEAQEREADRQRRFDSAKDLRDARRTAYAAYLTTVNQELEQINANWNEGGWIEPVTDVVGPAIVHLETRCTELTILGPPDVAVAARAVAEAVLSIIRGPNAETPFHELIPKRIQEFVQAAGAAVEGVPPQGQVASGSSTVITA
jgi:hypothetical protein